MGDLFTGEIGKELTQFLVSRTISEGQYRFTLDDLLQLYKLDHYINIHSKYSMVFIITIDKKCRYKIPKNIGKRICIMLKMTTNGPANLPVNIDDIHRYSIALYKNTTIGNLSGEISPISLGIDTCISKRLDVFRYVKTVQNLTGYLSENIDETVKYILRIRPKEVRLQSSQKRYIQNALSVAYNHRLVNNSIEFQLK